VVTRVKTRKVWLLALLAIAALCVLVPRGVNALGGGGDSPVHSGFTGLNDPTLQQALATESAAGERDDCSAQCLCNRAAEAARKGEKPEASPPEDNPAYFRREKAEAYARAGARTEWSPDGAPATAVVYSALLTRQQFEQLTPDGHNPGVHPDRKVWVVTVHAPMWTDGSPSMPPLLKPVYSVALDAETGQWTDACIGCAWLDHSE